MSVATVSDKKIFVRSGDKRRKSSTRLANAMALELLNYGIVPEKKLVRRIGKLPKEEAREVCEQILALYTIGQINPPLFSDWEDRTYFFFGEMVVQILGYTFQFCGNDMDQEGFMEELEANVDYTGKQKLKLASENATLKRFETLVNANAALDRGTFDDLVALAKVHWAEAPDNIRSDQARIACILGAVQSGLGLGLAFGGFASKNSDVLRYLAGLVDTDKVNLPSDVKYATVGWRDRLELLGYLESATFDDLCEDFGNNRGAWNRFFKHIHLFQQGSFRTKFPTVLAAAYVSLGSKIESVPKGPVRRAVLQHQSIIDTTDSGNMVYRTFASRVQTAVDNKDFDTLEAEILNRPGYLFRNLATLSHVCTRRSESRFVDMVRGLIDRPSTSVLLSLVQIDVNAKYRIIDSKGTTTVQEANYAPVIAEIQGLAEREIYQRHGFEGKVACAKSLRTKMVPFLSTNAELDRGTRIPFDNAPYLYFLMHWVERAGRRTDLDHSYVSFDADWNKEIVYFGNQANSYIAHGGDITSAPAPNGATEYGLIRLDRVPSKVRYIVPIINVYSGDVFSENHEAYAGFMFSDSNRFDLKRDHVRYDLTQPAQTNTPFVIDMKNREIIIVDFNNRTRLGSTAHSSGEELKQIIMALETKKFMTMERFADLLSGDEDKECIKISTKTGKNKIQPSDLVKLVS